MNGQPNQQTQNAVTEEEKRVIGSRAVTNITSKIKNGKNTT